LLITTGKSQASSGLAEKTVRSEKEISGVYRKMKWHSTGEMKLCVIKTLVIKMAKATDLETKAFYFEVNSQVENEF